MSARRFPIHTDARGRLLIAEDAEIGFPVRRVFAITAVPPGAMRGEHVVQCRETIVLVSGAATFWISQTADGPATEHQLGSPGDAVDVVPGVWLRYTLSGPGATVIVFADAPFQPRMPVEEQP